MEVPFHRSSKLFLVSVFKVTFFFSPTDKRPVLLKIFFGLMEYSWWVGQKSSEFQYKLGLLHVVWSPGDNQDWTTLFLWFDVSQLWFTEYEKHQRWSTLFQSRIILIYSESAWIFTHIDDNIKMWYRSQKGRKHVIGHWKGLLFFQKCKFLVKNCEKVKSWS